MGSSLVWSHKAFWDQAGIMLCSNLIIWSLQQVPSPQSTLMCSWVTGTVTRLSIRFYGYLPTFQNLSQTWVQQGHSVSL